MFQVILERSVIKCAVCVVGGCGQTGQLYDEKIMILYSALLIILLLMEFY